MVNGDIKMVKKRYISILFLTIVLYYSSYIDIINTVNTNYLIKSPTTSIFQNITIKSIKDTSVVIEWEVSENLSFDYIVTSQIEYGLDTDYGYLTEENEFAYFHRHELTNLFPGTTYHFRIRAKDFWGNEYISDDYTFTTRTSDEVETIIRAARSNNDLPKVYYVKPDGDDSNDGLTPETAWKSPSYAAQVAEPGDIIYLMNGTWYDEHITFANSGIDIAPIVMKAYPGATPVLDGVDKTGEAILIEGKSHIVIEGLTIRNYETGIRIFQPYGKELRYVTLKDNKISEVGGVGIGAKAVGSERTYILYLTILNNIITDSGVTTGEWSTAAIALQKTSYSLIKGNKLKNVSAGIAFASYVHHNIVEDNYIEKTTHSSLGFGIDFGHSSYNNVIRNNTLVNIIGRATRLDEGCKEFLIIGHKMETWGEAGLWVYEGGSGILAYSYFGGDDPTKDYRGAGGFGGGPWYFIGNTFKNTGMSIYEGGGSTEDFDRPHEMLVKGNVFIRGSLRVDATINSAIINNIFVDHPTCLIICPGGRNTAYDTENLIVANNVFYKCNDAIYIYRPDWWPSSSTVKNVIIKNNIFSEVNNYCVNNEIGKNITISYNCVFNCVSPYFYNVTASNTLEADPLFANPPDDFHLKSQAGRWDPNLKQWVYDPVTSPCIDAGDPEDDYSNEPEPNGGRINMGAYGNTIEASRSPGLEVQRVELEKGWNLISVYTYPKPTVAYKASDLAEDIGAKCRLIAKWDSSSQKYMTYIPGFSPEEYNFEIEPGYGYFVYLDTSTLVELSGVVVRVDTIELKKGWNLVGWDRDEITAKEIAQSIGGECKLLAKWISREQKYTTYIPGFSPEEYNFKVKRGEAIFIYMEKTKTWTKP